MDGVNQGDYVVQQIVFVEYLMGEKGLDNWFWVGYVGVFNYQLVKFDFVVIVIVEEIEQGVFQFVGVCIVDIVVGQGFNLCGVVVDELIVDGDFVEFVFNYGDFEIVLFIEDMVQEGGFFCVEKIGEQGDCNWCYYCFY